MIDYMWYYVDIFMCTCSFTRGQESRSIHPDTFTDINKVPGTIFSLLNQHYLTSGAVNLNLGNTLIMELRALSLAFLSQPPCASLLSVMEMKRASVNHARRTKAWVWKSGMASTTCQQFVPGKQQATATMSWSHQNRSIGMVSQWMTISFPSCSMKMDIQWTCITCIVEFSIK